MSRPPQTPAPPTKPAPKPAPAKRPTKPAPKPAPAKRPKSTTSSAHLYSVAELAKEWECSDQHIYNLIAGGYLDVVDIGIRGGRAKTRIPAASVDDFVSARTRPATRRPRALASVRTSS